MNNYLTQGKRYTFTATYVGCDYHKTGELKNGVYYYAPVIRLNNLNYRGHMISRNIEINYTKQFAALGELTKGEIIQFDARIKITTNHDFTLSYPNCVNIVKSITKSRRPMPNKRLLLVGYAVKRCKHYDESHPYLSMEVIMYNRWREQSLSTDNSG